MRGVVKVDAMDVESLLIELKVEWTVEVKLTIVESVVVVIWVTVEVGWALCGVVDVDAIDVECMGVECNFEVVEVVVMSVVLGSVAVDDKAGGLVVVKSAGVGDLAEAVASVGDWSAVALKSAVWGVVGVDAIDVLSILIEL